MIGDTLKQLRTKKGLTSEELCVKIGIKGGSYRNYERNDRKPDYDTLVKLADFYGVSTDYLLGRPTATPPTDPVDALISSKDFDEIEEILLKKYLELPHDARMAVVQFMHEVTEEAEKRKAHAEEQGRKPALFVFHRCSEHRVSAGIGYDLNDPDAWRDITVVDTPEARQADFMVQIDGDSMEPEYHDGDYVYVEINPDVSIGKVGIFQDIDKGYIKMRGKDRLISLNPEYDDIPLTEDMKCVGVVIGIAELPE